MANCNDVSVSQHGGQRQHYYLILGSSLLVVLLILCGFEQQGVDGFVSPVICHGRSKNIKSFSKLRVSTSPDELLKQTAAHLEKLQRNYQNRDKYDKPMSDEVKELYDGYIVLPSNTLKVELKEKNLRTKGRKPDLARRLAEYEVHKDDPVQVDPWLGDQDDIDGYDDSGNYAKLPFFAGLPLSDVAGLALGKAQFTHPSPIQKSAIPLAMKGESIILHAETGSGKTLAYLLPITEQLWYSLNEGDDTESFALIMTPTRELATQVAGIATTLAPKGAVRFVAQPSNLLSASQTERDCGELEGGGRVDFQRHRQLPRPRIYIGTAKAIMTSLYGDDRLPAAPTPKPMAKYLLENVSCVVLDEVDRLLKVNGSTKRKGPSITHETPAAIVTAAVAKWTLGRAQVISASATVGRPLKRELSRVLGLLPQDCPQVVRGGGNEEQDHEQDEQTPAQKTTTSTTTRAVTIPDTVKNYIAAVDGTTSGKLLTHAYQIIRSLAPNKKILFVLTRGFGISTQNSIGALKHFKCKPEPKSLLDVLQADGTDGLISVHRQVSGATGVGEQKKQSRKQQQQEQQEEDDEDANNNNGYLLVTGEDSVRGLHLDGLDVVIVVGRAFGPDEYMHIAGRTGRAGRQGVVINIVSKQDASKLVAWESMLNLRFIPLDPKRASEL